jgi:CheY-like chemotaxis protein/uncharacterized Zn-finger protein
MNPAAFKYRILVVDDDEMLRNTSKWVLEQHGYEVHVASDGFDALQSLQQALPDIIISDLAMPNMSGFEFLSVVRKRFPHIGVIAVSADFSPLSAPESVLADAFFAKPSSSPQQLFSEIASLLKQAPIRPQVKPTESAAVWMPRGRGDFLVVVCPYCLRTTSTAQPESDEAQRVACSHCPQKFTFRMAP